MYNNNTMIIKINCFEYRNTIIKLKLMVVNFALETVVINGCSLILKFHYIAIHLVKDRTQV